jgi:Uma2 family endonuclease
MECLERNVQVADNKPEMLSTKKKRYTYKDYQELPEGAPYQLINGDLVMTPAPNTYHQRISKRLERELLKLEERGAGEVLHAPTDVYFSDTETYQPDILFISKERLAIIGEQRIEGAPDLIMEILSPSTAYYDLKAKMRVYENSGVREYWVIDPMEKSIEIYQNKEGSFLLAEKAILGSKSGKGSVSSRLFDPLKIDLKAVFNQPDIRSPN